MGQFPQDGENSQNVAFFVFFEALLWPNRYFLLRFFNCSGPIMSLRVWNYFCFAPPNLFWYPAMIIFLPYLPIFELRLPYEKALVWL